MAKPLLCMHVREASFFAPSYPDDPPPGLVASHSGSTLHMLSWPLRFLFSSRHPGAAGEMAREGVRRNGKEGKPFVNGRKSYEVPKRRSLVILFSFLIYM